jgi:hypothetical protein
LWIENGKLNAYRCGNPLSRGRHNGSTYLASEGDYLKEIGCTHVKELSEGMIYTFDSPFGIRTQRVSKNKTFTSTYGIGAKGYHNDIYTGQGWEDYLDKTYGRKPSHSIIPTSLILTAHDAEIKEDFRTPSDIAKQAAGGEVDHCDCCGDLAELSDGGMCLACITWLDSQGVSRDNPPA